MIQDLAAHLKKFISSETLLIITVYSMLGTSGLKEFEVFPKSGLKLIVGQTLVPKKCAGKKN